jgi:quinol monooxygenase YgiN
VLVVNRFVIEADDEAVATFTQRAGAAVEALAARPGYLRGQLGRAYDDPTRWTLVTEWESVGAYRRALGAFDVKVQATPLLAESLDEPSAFEVLTAAAPEGRAVGTASDRAPDPRSELGS